MHIENIQYWEKNEKRRIYVHALDGTNKIEFYFNAILNQWVMSNVPASAVNYVYEFVGVSDLNGFIEFAKDFKGKKIAISLDELALSVEDVRNKLSVLSKSLPNQTFAFAECKDIFSRCHSLFDGCGDGEQIKALKDKHYMDIISMKFDIGTELIVADGNNEALINSVYSDIKVLESLGVDTAIHKDKVYMARGKYFENYFASRIDKLLDSGITVQNQGMVLGYIDKLAKINNERALEYKAKVDVSMSKANISNEHSLSFLDGLEIQYKDTYIDIKNNMVYGSIANYIKPDTFKELARAKLIDKVDNAYIVNITACGKYGAKIVGIQPAKYLRVWKLDFYNNMLNIIYASTESDETMACYNLEKDRYIREDLLMGAVKQFSLSFDDVRSSILACRALHYQVDGSIQALICLEQYLFNPSHSDAYNVIKYKNVYISFNKNINIVEYIRTNAMDSVMNNSKYDNLVKLGVEGYILSLEKEAENNKKLNRVIDFYKRMIVLRDINIFEYIKELQSLGIDIMDKLNNPLSYDKTNFHIFNMLMKDGLEFTASFILKEDIAYRQATNSARYNGLCVKHGEKAKDYLLIQLDNIISYGSQYGEDTGFVRVCKDNKEKISDIIRSVDVRSVLKQFPKTKAGNFNMGRVNNIAVLDKILNSKHVVVWCKPINETMLQLYLDCKTY